MVAKKSGYRLEPDDIPIVRGMIARNDRRHDIAAWFGVNQGRIPGADKDDYGDVEPPRLRNFRQAGHRASRGGACEMLLRNFNV